MATEALKSATFKQKEIDNIPKGATILSKDVTITVEEIENGFLICKSINVKYQKKDSDYNDYSYVTKKYFAKENPLEIDMEKVSDKSLADSFS